MSQEEVKVEEIPMDKPVEATVPEDLGELPEMVGKNNQMNLLQGRMKKYNKAIKKIFSQEKMKPQQKVDQIIIQKGDKLIWIREPSLYKNNGSVYGFGGISDVMDVAETNEDGSKKEETTNVADSEKAVEKKEEDLDEQIADIELKDDDIMTVVDQANVTKEKAIEALKKCKGDVIEAIYSLE
eukprot:GAHX01000464.1.p1 GENE.GAHX01000464.1~~GAHX01000464.1.p1  ORF type:complete len:183 (-),score=58.97 GAHX01000464.1:35-583(-)